MDWLGCTIKSGAYKRMERWSRQVVETGIQVVKIYPHASLVVYISPVFSCQVINDVTCEGGIIDNLGTATYCGVTVYMSREQ